jgi:hypothetical protein
MASFRQVTVAVLFMWLVASSLWVYPHSISYFNDSIDGPLPGPKYLLGSHVEWGSDSRYFAEWIEDCAGGLAVYISWYRFIDLPEGGIATSVVVPRGGNLQIVNALTAWCAVSSYMHCEDLWMHTSTQSEEEFTRYDRD